MAKQAKTFAAKLQTGAGNRKIPLHQLSPDKRLLVVQLTQRYSTCKLLAKAPTHRAVVEDTSVEVANPTMGKTMSGTTNMKLADTAADFTKAIKGELQTMVPTELAERKVFNLKGHRATKAMDTIVAKFKDALKKNPKLRTASGLHPDQAEAAIKSFVKGLKLPSAMRGKLQSSLQAMVAALPNPSTIKNFTGEKVGTGGMGNVFSATYDGKNVIVKQSKDGTTTADTRNTLHEVLTHESIIHNPNLPKIHGLFLSDDKKLTLVMEKVPGADCSGLFMKKSDWVTIPDNSDNPAFRAAKVPLAAEFHKLGSEDKMKASVHILAGIVNGLAAMHASGIGHYDLKPANMMFNSETMQGTLIDFGVSGVPGQNSKITASSSLLPNDNYPQSPRNSTEFPPLNEEVYALGEMIRKDFLEEVDDADKLPGAQRAVVDTAINILKGDPASSRPTMAQLNQIFKGEPVTLATGAQEGIKTQANLDDLKNAFGPNGAFGGGLDILSGMIARAPAPAPAPTT